MSLLDRVEEKYRTPTEQTDKTDLRVLGQKWRTDKTDRTDKSPSSVSFVSYIRKDSENPRPAEPRLLRDILAAVEGWLDHIGEHDDAIRAECLDAPTHVAPEFQNLTQQIGGHHRSIADQRLDQL